MPQPDPYLIFTRKLDELRLPYMVSGSVAAIYYGEPRMTNDVDIVLFLNPEDVPRFEDAFPPAEFYRPPREVILIELARPQRGHFNLIDLKTGFKADLYLSGSDPLHAWALARARKIDLESDALTLAPPEYVILRKLQFYREGRSAKHLRDVHRMLVVQGESWDRSALEGMVEQQGLQAEWKAARDFSP